MTNFGQYVNKLRLEKKITLREFSRRTGLDPSNWSKVERGLSSPPKSKEVLNSITETLGLEKNSDEYLTLFELAAIGFIPADLLPNQNVVDRLPVFFRTVRGEKSSKEELGELLKLIED